MNDQNQNIQYFYLTDVIGIKVINQGKKIGKLADFVITENGGLPMITNIFISRPFGDSSLFVPWEKVLSFKKHEINVDIEDVEKFEKNPDEHIVLLKDHILDKKIIDIQDREVEVVYDVHLVLKDNKLYVSDVDLSKQRMLQRLGLNT